VSAPSCAACKLPFTPGAAEYMCRADACPNPRFHAACVPAAQPACDMCTASGAPLNAAAEAAEPAELLIVESSGLSEAADRALRELGHVPAADVHGYGAVRAFSLFNANPTKDDLASLVKTMARHLRENNSVGADLLRRLEEYKIAGWAKIFKTTDDAGMIKQLWAPIVTPTMADAMYTNATLGDALVLTDDSYGLIGSISKLNLFAWLSPVAAAGGATMPFMVMLYQTGSGVEGDMAAALTFARTFLFEKRMELYTQRAAAHAAPAAALRPPPPQPPFPPLNIPLAQLIDKSASEVKNAFDDFKALVSCDDASARFALYCEDDEGGAEGDGEGGGGGGDDVPSHSDAGEL
jgi:hypothetical protein